MVSKIVFRLALIAGFAVLAFAGSNLLTAPPVSSPNSSNDGWEQVEIPLERLVVRPGHSLDAEQVTIPVEDFEAAPAWTSSDLTVPGTPYWNSAAVPIGDPNAPALWCGDPLMIDNLVAPGGYANHQQHYLISPTLDLSGSSAPITLGFKARWKLENPGGETPPYNMWDGWTVQYSIDGGTTWTIPGPAEVSLPFTGTCAYAWKDHCYEGCFAAWGGTAHAAAYDVMTVNLNSLAGQSNVKFRFGMLSDPAASANDGQLDSSYYGLIIDSVRFTNSATTLLSNDGDNITGWSVEAYPVSPVGNTWVYEDSTAPTGMDSIPDQVWSWNAEHRGLATIENALTSPPILLPDTARPGFAGPTEYNKLVLAYYVWCDLVDQDGDNDGALDDLYEIHVSNNNGLTWERVAYDYAYDNSELHPDAGNSANGWVRRSRGLATGGIAGDIDLTRFGEQTVLIQFRLQTDCNNDGGIGSGLHVDAISLVGTRAYAIDAATRNLIVPFPVTVGLSRSWSFQYVNEGANNIGNALRYRSVIKRPNGTTADSVFTQFTATLATGEFATVPRTFTPTIDGSHRFNVYSQYPSEQDRSNDTTRSPINVPLNANFNMAVEVQPAGSYELGYHLRDYSAVLSNPRLVRYSADEAGVPAADSDTMDINRVQIMWNWDPDAIDALGDGTARCRLNFYGEGPDNRTPGALLYTYEEEIDTNETVSPYGGDSLLNRWWTKDLSAIAVLKRLQGDFWVEVMGLDSVEGTGLPGLLAFVTNPQDTTDTHNYTRRLDLAGEPILASPSRFCVEVLTKPTVWPDPATRLTILRDGVTNDVTLRWTAGNRADGYLVYRTNDPAIPLQTLLTPVPIPGTTYTDTGAVAAGDKFFYVVIAVNS